MSQPRPPSPTYLAKLRRNLTGLAETDLRNFCFDHDIEYDALPTTTLSVPDKARAIVDYLNKRERLGELVVWGQHEFPNLIWEIDEVELPKSVTGPTPDAPTAESAPLAPSRRLWLTLGLVVAFLALVGAVALAIRSASSSPEPSVPTPSATQTTAPSPTTSQPPTPISLPTDTSQAAMVGNVAASAVTSTLAPTLTLPLAPGVDMEFVLVPAGEFLMGSDPSKDEDAQPNEQPQHRVDLSEYYIAKYELTNAQFEAFVNAASYKTDAEKEGGYLWTGKEWIQDKNATWRSPLGESSSIESKSKHPVTQVSWNDAVAFSKWLSNKTGEPIGLPTEAEWEKACRGPKIDKGNGNVYPWGNEFDPQKLNSAEGDIGGTSPVGRYSSAGDSPYNAADLSGNVWEWTADWYDENVYKDRSRATPPVKDPTAPASDKLRTLRGGAFGSNSEYARCAYRYRRLQDDSFNFNGFRVVIRAHTS